jgi:hypothetical protein
MDIQARIAELARRAQEKEGFELDRARLFAHYWVHAGVQDEGEEVSEGHTVKAIHEDVGECYGYRDGYQNLEEVKALNARGRAASRQVHAAAAAAYKKLARLSKVHEKNFADLPKHIRDRWPVAHIQQVSESILQLSRWADRRRDPLKAARARAVKRNRPTRAAQTYIWWREFVEPEASWDEMYALAKLWRISDSQDIASFQRVVKREMAKVRKAGTVRFCAPPSKG